MLKIAAVSLLVTSGVLLAVGRGPKFIRTVFGI